MRNSSFLHLIEFLLPSHDLLLFLSEFGSGYYNLLTFSKLDKLESLLLFQVTELFEFCDLCVNIGTPFDEFLEDVDEWLHDDLVEEVSRHGHFLFLGESGVVVVVVTLICEFIEYISISQLIHASVVPIDETLLVHFVANRCQQLVVLLSERLNVSKKGSLSCGVKSVHCLLGWRVILKKLLQDSLVLNIENLLLEGEEEVRLAVNRNLVLQELKKRSIVFLKADSKGSAIVLILGAEFSFVLNKKLSNLLLDLNLALVNDL